MTDNIFADLVPQKGVKPKRTLRRRGSVSQENMFADLVPQREEPVMSAEEQTPNIGMKGNKKPGSHFEGDLRETTAQGAWMNFWDEVAAGVGVPVQMIYDRMEGNGLSVGETYDQNLAAVRSLIEKTRIDYPTLAPLSEVGGALSTAVIPGTAAVRGVQLSKAAPGVVRALVSGKGLVPMAARGSALGGVTGGIAGAGEGQGADDRLARAEEGAGVGAGIGLVAPGAGKLVGSGYRLVRAAGRAATAPVRALRRPETFAAQKVAEAAERDGMSTQRLANRLDAATDLKPDAVLADVAGTNTQKLLRAAANVPSKARAGLTRKLFNRQDAQRARLSDDLGEAFGDPKTFHKTVEDAALARKAKADPLFAAARNTPTPWTKRLQDVLQRPLMRKLVADAEEAAANRGEKFKSFFAQQIPGTNKFKISRVPSTDDLHRIKVQIDDMIRKLKKGETTSLGNIDVRQLTILKQHLLGAIDNKAYKTALREFAGDSAVMNALDEGFEEGLKMEPEAIAKALSGLSSSEAEMWRLGFGRAVANKLRDSGVAGANRAERLYSPAFMDRLMVVFRDPKSRARFLKKLNMERRMFRTKNQVEGNSTTQSQFVEGAEAAADAEAFQKHADLGRDLINQNYIGALVKWVGRAKSMATGLQPAVADEIIKLLTTQDPVKVARAQFLIDKALKKVQGRATTPKRITNAVTTGAMGTVSNLQSDGR